MPEVAIRRESFDGVLSGSDILDIALYAGHGGFGSGYGGFGPGDIANGTYSLMGDDAGVTLILITQPPGRIFEVAAA